MPHGIDISHFDPDLDYKRAHAEGAEFIVHKASEGTGTDPTYARRAPAIRASGAVPGAYHFLRSSPSAAEQVAHFLSVIGDPAGLLVQLDWELSGSDLAPVKMARAWVAEWHARTGGHPVLIYLPRWVWADHLGSPGGLGDLGPLWASHYLPGSTLTLADAARVPASWWGGYGGWPRASIVQYAGEAGRIAGRGPADLNVTDLTLAELHQLAGNPQEEDVNDDQDNKLTNVYQGTFFGGESCGRKNPATNSNSVVAKLDYLMDAADRPPTTVDVDAAAVAAALAADTKFVNALAGAVAGEISRRMES